MSGSKLFLNLSPPPLPFLKYCIERFRRKTMLLNQSEKTKPRYAPDKMVWNAPAKQ